MAGSKWEFPHAGAGVVQVIDRDAFDRIAAKFNARKSDANFPGVLVDFDHFSLDTAQSSKAAGWITELEPRDTWQWARVRWSDALSSINCRPQILVKCHFFFAHRHGIVRRSRPEVAHHPLKDALRKVACDLRARVRTNEDAKIRIAGLFCAGLTDQ